MISSSKRSSAGGYDRPGKNASQSRSVVVAKHGIVAASQPLAAQVGLDILKRGGNAADAAIATNAMLGLTEPMSCGIGGDLFVIYWDNKTQKLYGLNGSGRSPYKLNRDVFKQKGLTSIPGTGCCAGSVPGCVAGWEDLRRASAASRWPRFWRRRSTMPKKAFPSARSLPATCAAASERLETWTRHGQDLSPRRPSRRPRARSFAIRGWPPAIGRSPRTGRPRFTRDRSPRRSSRSAKPTADIFR